MSYSLSIVAVALVCLTTLVVGALGLRLSRRTSDFYVQPHRLTTPERVGDQW